MLFRVALSHAREEARGVPAGTYPYGWYVMFHTPFVLSRQGEMSLGPLIEVFPSPRFP
jgi:hypothetical protein